MGVRHLTSFLEKNVDKGKMDALLFKDCEEFMRNNDGRRPLIVIDLMSIVIIFSKDKKGLLCGGRNQIYRSLLEELFRNLCAVAELVFFVDGFLADDKTNTYMTREDDRYIRALYIIDQIKRKVPCQNIIDDKKAYFRLTTCLPMIREAASKFGKLFVSVLRECDAELVRFANKNNAFAVMADDSDNLIYAGDWRYYSTQALDPKTLKTIEYNKLGLRTLLDLNDDQMVILSTLSGNDIIEHEEVCGFHKRKSRYYRNRHTFIWMATYIKERWPNLNNLYAVVDDIAKDVICGEGLGVKERIKASLGQYNTNFEEEDFTFGPLLQFCRDNHLNFAFTTLREVQETIKLNFVDLRITHKPNVCLVKLELLRRQIGVLLQHKRSKIEFPVIVKESHDKSYEEKLVTPVYPPFDVPDLMELLNRQKYPEHDETRFKLLKWMICEEELKSHDFTTMSQDYFVDNLVLTFMTSKKLITIAEADLIMRSLIAPSQNELVTFNISLLDENAFGISMMFTTIYALIQRCLEITGLKDSMSKLLSFDGELFHKMYWHRMHLDRLGFQNVSIKEHHCLYKIQI